MVVGGIGWPSLEPPVSSSPALGGLSWLVGFSTTVLSFPNLCLLRASCRKVAQPGWHWLALSIADCTSLAGFRSPASSPANGITLEDFSSPFLVQLFHILLSVVFLFFGYGILLFWHDVWLSQS